MTLYSGIGGVQKEVGALYAGIGGASKQLDQLYAGVGGVAKELLPPAETEWLFDTAGTYTWTVPRTGSYYVRVLSGGGAGGTGGNGNSSKRGGGGGGGSINEANGTLYLIQGNDVSLNIGSGAVGIVDNANYGYSDNGSPGGQSLFGNLLSANSGGGGGGGKVYPGGGEGAGGTYPGSSGGSGSSALQQYGGAGGTVTISGITRTAGAGGQGGKLSNITSETKGYPGGSGQDGLIYIQLQQ